MTSAISLLVGQTSLQIDRLAVVAGAQRFGGDVDRSPCPAAHRRRPAAATPGSWPAHWHARGPRSCGCRRSPRRRPACCPRSRRRSRRPAGRSCRCRSCSHSRPVSKPIASRSAVRPDFVEILGDHLRAGRQRGLHPRLRLQPLGVRLARHQAGGHQHRRVRRVGARGDRRDHHVAMGQFVVLALDLHRWSRPRSPARRGPWSDRP